MSSHEQIIKDQSAQKMNELIKRIRCGDIYGSQWGITSHRRKTLRKLVNKIEGRSKRVSRRLRLLNKDGCRFVSL